MNLKKTKLSFIIPAHNEAAYIGRCLQSILAEIKLGQYNAEVIVINNTSTDKTRDIAQSFNDVKVVDEPRKGAVYARQTGFKVAVGDYIISIDADSRIPAGWVQTALQEFAEQKTLVAASGPVEYYDASPALNRAVRWFYIIGFGSYLVNRFVLQVGSILQGGAFIVKRSALEKIGHRYSANFEFWGDDIDLARRLCEIGDVKFTYKLKFATSGRRVIAEGPIIMGTRYSMNALSATFLKKPYTKHYIDVR